MRLFDRKMGADFLSSIPCQPGIYRIYSVDSLLIYVGKAKNLRRRLSQYRNAKRRKKHRKMKLIVQEASHIEIEICGSDLEATLLETELIQLHRPKWNVAGAFFFLYPLIGMCIRDGVTSFCYTTEPGLIDGFEFYGAFRSRQRTRDAFFSLVRLLSYVGHRSSGPSKRDRMAKRDRSDNPDRTAARDRSLPKYSYTYSFRQLPPEWVPLWSRFWKGESREALEALVLALVENAGARKRSQETQKKLNDLARFWRHEAIPLAKAREFSQYPSYPVSQKDRDLIFLKYRSNRESLRSNQ